MNFTNATGANNLKGAGTVGKIMTPPPRLPLSLLLVSVGMWAWRQDMICYFLRQLIHHVKLHQSLWPLRTVVLLAALGIGFVGAQPSQAPGTLGSLGGQAQPAAPQGAIAPGPAARGVSRLALSVTQLGAFRCVERADQVARFLGRGAGDIFIVDRPGPGSNIDLISVTMIVNQGGGSHSTIEISLTPTAAGCTAAYAASVSVAEPCEQAERKLYSGQAFKPVESAAPHRIATIGNEARVLSRPVPGGCVLTKHEVVR